MKFHQIILVGLFGSLLYCSPAAALCTSYPNTLTNGTVADGGQTMANFNCAALTSGSTLNGITITGTTTLPGSSAISSGGAVGIGMTPVNILDITQNQNSASKIQILNNNTGTAAEARVTLSNGTHVGIVEVTSTGWNTAFFTGGPTTAEQMNVGTSANAPLIFGTNNTARLTITSAGSVGIGTTSPATTLAVVGNIRVGTSGTNGCLQNFAGTALTGTCSSDAALKTVTGEVTKILDKFGKLQLVRFYWNKTAAAVYHNSSSALNTGFIAQEVQHQFPELVSIDSKGYRQIDYTTLSLYGLEATKELKAANDQQVARLGEQADQLANLQSAISSLEAVNDNQSRTIEKLQAQLKSVNDSEAAKIERLEAQMSTLERRVGIRTAQR